jgi:hypothetical protein
MNYWVGCTITTNSTNLSCDIEIGHVRIGNKDGYYNWKKIGGRLDLRDEDGNWMYLQNVGVSVCSTADTNNPYFYDDGNYLVVLYNVPDRFAEKLGCGEYFYGDGKITSTNEDVRWKMWYPCV